MQTESRVRIFYNGRVQGVGFRFSFEDAAVEYGIKGFVRNRSDGSVEAVCEGEETSIERLLLHISRTMSGHIVNSEISRETPRGEFKDFQIRY